MRTLDELLAASAALHDRLCPRQVLGVRMGLLAGQILDVDLPQRDKRLLTIVETDGCAVDGVAVATNCWVGRRTLRVEDYGKVAATFVDTLSGRAVRIVPHREARRIARDFAPDAGSPWEAYLLGYKRLPAESLLSAQAVRLRLPIAQILSQPGKRAVCERCGEEIVNEREVLAAGAVLCRPCSGQSYYRELAVLATPRHGAPTADPARPACAI